MGTPSPKQLALGDLEHELAQTRRVLERVPEDRLEWRPHEKSMTLGHLAQHLATLPTWPTAVLQQDDFDVATVPPPPAMMRSRAELLHAFDEAAAGWRRALEQADDAALGRSWTLRRGEQVMLQLPRATAVRTLGISHMVHHRAQLAVYFRLLDVPVPALYGPSADEGVS